MNDEKRFYQEELSKAKKHLEKCKPNDIVGITEFRKQIKNCEINLTRLKNQEDQTC